MLEASPLGGPNTDSVAILTGAISVGLGVTFLAFPVVFRGGLSTHFSLVVMGCAFVAMGFSRPALARCLALPMGIANVAIFIGYIKYGPPGLDTVIIVTLWPETRKIWSGDLNADLAYGLTAIAILLLTEPGWRFRWRSTAIVLAGSAVVGLGVVGLCGYLTGLQTAYGLRRLMEVSPNSIVGALVLGAGLLIVSWRKGRHVVAERQAWILVVVAMAGLVVSTSLWQGFLLIRTPAFESSLQSRSSLARLVFTFGLLATAILSAAVAFVQKLRGLNLELERRMHQQTAELLARKQAEQNLASANDYNRSLIEASIDPLVTIGADGQITDVNAATEAATGHSRDELIGTDFCDYFTDPARARAGYQQVFRESSVRDYELGIRHRDGRVMPVVYNASVYRNRAGRVAGVFAVARDITARKGAELALRGSEERYRALVLASSQMVWTTTPDGLVEDIPMWRAYTGQTPPEVRGWGWLNAIHPDDRESTAAIWSKAVASRGMYETEYRIRRADGQYRHFAIRGVPVLEQGGSIREWVGTCTDIHERKQIEDELRKHAVLLNLAHDAIMVTDLQYRITFWNRGAEEIYGWSAKEASGRISPELLHTEFPVPLPEIRTAVQKEGEWEGELKHLTRDGRKIVVASRWSLQRDHHGAPTNVLEINRDITERKHLENELRAKQVYTRSLIEASLDPLVTIAPDGRITDVNRATEEITGIPRTELVGSDFCDYFTEPDKARAGYQQVFAEGQVQDYALAIRHRSGRVTEVLYNASVYRNEAGEVEGVFAAARDITERKHLENELRAKQAYTRSLIEASLDPLVTIASDGKITDVNRATEQITGVDRAELVGSDFSTYFTEPEKARAGYRQVFAEGLVQDYSLAIRHRSGRVKEVLYNASVFRDPAGEVEGVFAAARDITERKRLEEGLRQRTGELENAVAELEAFSYSVSHDLRAPLRSIDGFSQILLEDYEDKVDAEGQDSLRRIRAASQNMAQLIDALLQLSRVMRAELSRETVELSILALSTAAMIQKADPRPHLHFGVTAGLQVRGDRRLLGIALQNLLQNAWKFSARNSDPIIEFGSISKDGQTAYYVRDNGIGFDMTYANKLFTPFQRLHSKEQFEGTGIGLATVQRIIKRHGGRVWAEGAVGKGATFYFSLE